MNGEVLPVIGPYEIINVYDYFDKPLLFSIRNQADSIYIVSFASARRGEDKWMASQVSEPRLREFETGIVSIREVFEKPQIGYTLLLNISKDGQRSTVEFIQDTANGLGPFLADADEYVNVESLKMSEASEMARARMPKRSRVLVNLRLAPNSGSRSTMNIKVLGDLLSSFQETLSNIGMNIIGIDNERGRIPFSIFEATSLDYAVAWNGSVGITLFSSEVDVLIESDVLERSLETLSSLVNGNVVSFFGTKEEPLKRSLSRRTLLKFKSFLGSLRVSGSDFEMAFESKNGEMGYAAISEGEVYQRISEVDSYADHAQRIYELQGKVTEVNSTTGRIVFSDIETEAKYVAYVEDSSYFEANQMKVPGVYRLTILENTSINKNTGEEINSYTVVSFGYIEE